MLFPRPWRWIFAILVCALAGFESQHLGDFDIYLTASSELFQQGRNPYVIFFHEAYHYFYSVTFLVLLQPLTLLPVWLATLIWNLTGAFLSWRLLELIRKEIPPNWLSIKQERIWCIVLFVFMFSVWLKNLHVGQVTLLMTWAMWQSWVWFKDGRHWRAGLLLAFVISLKLMPLVLIPFLIWRGKWKGLGTTAVSLVVIGCLPWLVLDEGIYQTLLRDRWLLLNPDNAEHILDVSERSMHSLTTLLATLLVAEAKGLYTEDIPRHVANVSLETLAVVIRCVQACFVLGALWFTGKPWFRGKLNGLETWYALAYIMLAAVLIFPHQQHYAFFMATPAMAYVLLFTCMTWRSENKARWMWAGLLLLIFWGFNSHFLLGALNWFWNHFKTLTYAALLLTGMLALLPPARLESFRPRLAS